MKSKESKLYPSDLTLVQWLFILPLFPKPKSRPGSPGRPARDLRVIVNAIFYINKGGIQWRMLPKEYGPWSTAYGYFNRWSKSGLWKKVMNVPRKKERQRQNRKADPSAGCVDSQSVKTVIQGKDVGIDGGKLVKGRKRHILVDTLGILLVVVVTSANTSDKKGVKELLKHYFAKGVNRL